MSKWCTKKLFNRVSCLLEMINFEFKQIIKQKLYKSAVIGTALELFSFIVQLIRTCKGFQRL